MAGAPLFGLSLPWIQSDCVVKPCTSFDDALIALLMQVGAAIGALQRMSCVDVPKRARDMHIGFLIPVLIGMGLARRGRRVWLTVAFGPVWPAAGLHP